MLYGEMYNLHKGTTESRFKIQGLEIVHSKMKKLYSFSTITGR